MSLSAVSFLVGMLTKPWRDELDRKNTNISFCPFKSIFSNRIPDRSKITFKI